MKVYIILIIVFSFAILFWFEADFQTIPNDNFAWLVVLYVIGSALAYSLGAKVEEVYGKK